MMARKLHEITKKALVRRWSIMLSLVALVAFQSFGQPYTEPFDETAFWAGETMTGYNAKTYTNTADPANDMFSTNAAVREGTNVHSGAYSWRLNSVADSYFRYECETTVETFSVFMARWDNDPVPVFKIRYSTNSGTSYTDIVTLDGNWFTADKVYKKYQ